MLTDAQLQTLLANINHAKIGGISKSVPLTGVQIGVTGQAYAAGDVLGTGNPIAMEILTGPNGTAILYSATIGDLSKGDGAINMTFFSDKPTSTFTDGTALTLSTADLPKVLGVYKIEGTDYADYVSNSVATKSGSGFVIQNLSTTENKSTIWVCFTANDSKTYSEKDISANLGFLLD